KTASRSPDSTPRQRTSPTASNGTSPSATTSALQPATSASKPTTLATLCTSKKSASGRSATDDGRYGARRILAGENVRGEKQRRRRFRTKPRFALAATWVRG